ncbi:MAG: replicative DNA helicase [Candidatus Viridilinea halotolerans]|uniref:Replicative DNA helicase n=1 Tax=Candidatus Viridilinea halotolerans TaxID=2491704 RepID=A0A426TRH3_9CHLR|nr:MAG: replicative DNA helicase [Candidatus Viridilinea halotolerans]
MTTMPSLPHDLDAERATLGAMLLEREAVIALAPFLKPEHFYLEKHALIYEAQLACYERREPPDLATVAAQLRSQNHLATVGGASFLAELLSAVPTAVHVEYYARVVERTAMGRALIEAGGRVAALGYDDSRPIEDRLGEAAQQVFDVSAGRQVGRNFLPMSQIAGDYLGGLQTSVDEGELLGLTSGYPELDGITQGLKAGELVVLAARPGVGKTALALCMAYHVACRGHHVGIFSLEMDRELLLQRLIAIAMGVPTNHIPRLLRSGNVDAINALAHVAGLPIHVDHSPAPRITAIRDRARHLANVYPIDLWIVDYLQLVQSDNNRDDEVRRITQISQGLAGFAREQRTPVLALSQLSRNVENRANHVPVLADLRGSGSIEQDASQVWFIYRDELYHSDTDCPGIAELHVAKHRNGATGLAVLAFNRAATRFDTLDRKEYLKCFGKKGV